MVFSMVLDEILASLNASWKERGYQSQHGLHAWAYVDDVLLNFQSWEDAAVLLEELQNALAEAGLALNLQKTVVFSTAGMIQQGKEQLQGQECLLKKCTWATKATYLRRELTHPPEANVTGLIWQQAHKSFHMGWMDMQFVVKRLHWSDAQHALVFLNKYLTSRWIWLSPLMEPLVGHVKNVDTTQTSYAVSLLKLYLPPHLSHENAMCVNRLRRRAAQVVALANPKFRWTNLWVSREWGYLGHLLRKPDEHPCKRLLFSCEGHQAPWNSYIRWARKMVGAVLDLPPPALASREQLQKHADDREGWKMSLQVVQRQYEFTVVRMYETLWPNPRAPFRHDIHWLFTSWLSRDANGLRLSWIDKSEGVQVVSLQGPFEDTVLQTWTNLCMLRAPSPLVCQVLIGLDCLEENLQEAHRLVQEVSRRDQVLFFETIPSQWEEALSTIFYSS